VNRQLKNPRGLAVLKSGDKEYVVIADFDNGRVVVWDSTTKFIAEFKQSDMTPAAIAVSTSANSSRIFVLDRKKDIKAN